MLVTHKSIIAPKHVKETKSHGYVDFFLYLCT